MRRSLQLSLVFLAFAILLTTTATAQERPSPQNEPATASVIEKQELKTYTLPPGKYEKAVSYSRTQYTLHFVGVAYSLLVLLIVVVLRVAPALRDRAERISRKRIVQVLVFVPLLLLIFDVLKLPLDGYQHHLAVQYDISVQGWRSWFWDWAKGELIEFILASILAYILYGVIRRSPRRWWLYFGLASLPILVFFLSVSPVLIDPLFNKFEPLKDTHPSLVEEIERVVTNGGLEIPPDRMFLMRASEKVNALDAYVTGFGPSKRVVVWDTTIATMTTPQTLFVVGHEMGHYVLGHIPKGIAFVGAMIIVVFYFVFAGLNRTLAGKQRRWLIRGADDWASLPLLLFFVYGFFFLAEPGINTFSRFQEHQADVYGLEVIHGIVPDSARTAAGAFQILGEVDLADPHPGAFVKVWLYSHPPISERVEFSRAYDPWSKGQSPMFVK